MELGFSTGLIMYRILLVLLCLTLVQCAPRFIVEEQQGLQTAIIVPEKDIVSIDTTCYTNLQTGEKYGCMKVVRHWVYGRR